MLIHNSAAKICFSWRKSLVVFQNKISIVSGKESDGAASKIHKPYVTILYENACTARMYTKKVILQIVSVALTNYVRNF